MSRFLLALRCFFAVLLRARLPLEAIKLLPPPDLGGRSLPPAGRGDAEDDRDDEDARPVTTKRQEARPAPAPAPAPTPAPVAAPVQAPAPAPVAPAPEASATEREALRHRGAVQLLTVLQREGRLLDFLMEDVNGYTDAQIGAAVRDIHRGCNKGLREHVKVAPIRPEPDEAVVKIAAGHDPSQVRLIGNVTGRPPFEGTLRHHGWRAQQINLTDLPAGHDPTVICPAEVEIGA